MSRVVRLHETGGPEVLRVERREGPAPGPGEVLLRVHAIGLNRAEAMYRGRDKERLKLQIESGDVSAARDRIIVQAQREGR